MGHVFKIWRGGDEAESKEVARVNAWAQLDWFLCSHYHYSAYFPPTLHHRSVYSKRRIAPPKTKVGTNPFTSPASKKILLRMTSSDTNHSFPALRSFPNALLIKLGMGSPARSNTLQDDGVLKKGSERSPLSIRPGPSRGSINLMAMSPPNITITSSPPSQLFGLEPENIENSRLKSKNTKRVSIKETDSKTASALSALFPGRSPGNSKKLSPLGRRLSRRHTPLLMREDMSSVPEELQSPSPPGGIPTTKLAHGSPPRNRSIVPKLSPKKEPMSPLHPPRRQSRAISDHNYGNDFTLTPVILYNSSTGHYIHPMSASDQHYHQSPHWSGQVRVNPFSPIPEQYLRPPPTSTRSVSRGSFRKPGYYKLIDLKPPALPASLPAESKLQEPRKKTRLNPIRSTSASADSAPCGVPSFDNGQDFLSEISPTDVAQANNAFDTKMSGHKRKSEDLLRKPPPQSLESDDWQNDGNKFMRIKQGRYLDDFQEVKFLGSGSFGSVNACLSRLDGCTYAIKIITPAGQSKNCNDNTWDEQAGIGGADYLYGGRKMMSNQCAIPPNPRGSPSRRRKSKSRINIDGSDMADNCRDLGELQGSGHWNEGALRRMLREVSVNWIHIVAF